MSDKLAATAPKLISQAPRRRAYRERGCPAKAECSHPMICESHGCAARAAEERRNAEARSAYAAISDFDRNRVDAMMQAYVREALRLNLNPLVDSYCMAAALMQIKSMEASNA